MGQSVWIIGCKSAIKPGQNCPADQQLVIETTDGQLGGAGIEQLNQSDVAQVFSLAFGVVVLFFLVGRGVGQVLKMIRYG